MSTSVVEIILMIHVGLGVICILAALWVFVDTLNVNVNTLCRARRISLLSAGSMWLSFIAGGYWYVNFYKADKTVILKGPWPAGHTYFMETKEHLAIMLLLLATFLPIAAANELAANRAARRLVLWVAALVVLVGVLMEGHGAVIAMAVKMGLLAQTH